MVLNLVFGQRVVVDRNFIKRAVEVSCSGSSGNIEPIKIGIRRKRLICSGKSGGNQLAINVDLPRIIRRKQNANNMMPAAIVNANICIRANRYLVSIIAYSCRHVSVKTKDVFYIYLDANIVCGEKFQTLKNSHYGCACGFNPRLNRHRRVRRSEIAKPATAHHMLARCGSECHRRIGIGRNRARRAQRRRVDIRAVVRRRTLRVVCRRA